MSLSLFLQTEGCLKSSNLEEKLNLTENLAQMWEEGTVDLKPCLNEPFVDDAGRPEKPILVENFRLPKRSMASEKNHPAFIHALCHIEFNAINLALDAVYRFRDMPRDFYTDWIRVAREEAYHFRLLRDYLQTLGSDYGQYEAHDGLWKMALETAHDPLVRMALVPRVLEARGLDVTPGMIDKLMHHGKQEAADILKIIYRDEIGHVEIGSRWFNYLCELRELDAEKTFADLIESHAKERIRLPINDQARMEAGFNQVELDYLYTCI